MLIQTEMRFRDVAKRFLDLRVPQLGVAAQSRFRTQIERHILPAFGELKICEIDSLIVSEWLAAKAQAGLSWWIRIDLKGALSAIFTAAWEWNIWEKDNPTKGVRIGKKKLVRERRLLTVEQLRAILLALQPSSGSLFRSCSVWDCEYPRFWGCAGVTSTWKPEPCPYIGAGIGVIWATRVYQVGSR